MVCVECVSVCGVCVECVCDECVCVECVCDECVCVCVDMDIQTEVESLKGKLFI